MNIFIFNKLFYLSSFTFFKYLAFTISYPITYIIPIVLVVWAVFITHKKMIAFSILFLSGIISWLFAHTLKSIFMIDRPFMSQSIIPVVREVGYSFPSEHVAVFTGLTLALYFLNKKAGIVLGIFTLFIGVSRVVLGVHYPIDILGGVVSGSIIGLLLVYIFRKI